jgi:hypothetical protein
VSQTTTRAPRPPSARLVRGALAALVVAVVLAAPAAVAGSPLGHTALGSRGCASAAGTNQVWLVVDFGNVGLPGQPDQTVQSTCVSIPVGKTGSDVLGARATYAGNGLLCSIDGYPAGECGKQVGGKYQYWSYWHGGDSWTYTSIGPATWKPADGSVEGWHFVSGAGNPSDPPPGAPSASQCPPASTTTTAPATTTTTVGPGGPGGPGIDGPAAGGGGASRPAFHITPTIPAGTSGRTTAEPGSTSDTIPGEALTEAESATSLDGEGFATSGTERDGSASESASGQSGSDGGSSRSGGTGVPMAMAAGGVVILALGVTAALRFRVRPDDDLAVAPLDVDGPDPVGPDDAAGPDEPAP